MRVFLTGASGLLGSHLVETLAREGHHITALVGDIPSRSFLGQNFAPLKSQIELLEGRLDTATPKGNYDVVIHNAAKVSANSDDHESVWQVNFKDTQGLHSRLRGRFGKWVQISSIATICDGHRSVVNESNFGEARETAYAQSKLATDQWLLQNETNLLTIHPCYMLGKWDAKPSSGAVFFAVRFSKVSSYVDVTKNFVAAQDVAQGILQAISANVTGRYILGNENIKLSHFFDLLCREMNVENKLKDAMLSEQSSDYEKEFCLTSAVDISKAQKSFQYSPRVGIAEMLRETMDFFEQYKMLRRVKTP